jgi:hypothetical protein
MEGFGPTRFVLGERSGQAAARFCRQMITNWIVGVEMDASFTYGVTLRQTGSTTDQSQMRRRPS